MDTKVVLDMDTFQRMTAFVGDCHVLPHGWTVAKVYNLLATAQSSMEVFTEQNDQTKDIVENEAE